MKYRSILLIAALLLVFVPLSVAAQTPAATDAGLLYIVKAGDWLSAIARDLLGDTMAYMQIVQATNARAAQGETDLIENPDRIEIGQRIWVPGAAAAAPSGAQHPLWPWLQTATLQVEALSVPVTLVDGRASVAVVPGSASKVEVTLVNAAYTDLDGDGDEDAAAVIATSPGGSGTFYTLEAFINDQGQLTQKSTRLLGDRIKLRSLQAEQGEVTVAMLVAGPVDPLCCPATPETVQVAYSDGAWVD